MTPKRVTSQRIARLAARIVRLDPDLIIPANLLYTHSILLNSNTSKDIDITAADITALAASAMSQAEPAPKKRRAK